MYQPTLELTHKTVHHLIKLEHAIKEIKDTPLSAKVKKEILNRMGAENLHNLGKLTGAEVSYKNAEKIFKGKALVNQGGPDLLLSNYRSTCDFIYSSSNDRYISLSPSILLHLNKLTMNGIVDNWDTGRFRNVSDEVKPKYDNWSDKISQSSDDIEIQRHFFEILNWFSENKYHVHPLIKIGCTLYELFKIYPFVAGNLATILATAELLFEKSPLSLKGLFPISRNFVLYEDEYLEAINWGIEKNNNQTTWIERFVRGVSLDITTLKNEVIRIEEEKVQKKKKKLMDLNSRQLKIINYMKRKPRLYRKDYVKMMGVSTMTAYRDLNELVERKIIECCGGGRSTHYRLRKDKQENPSMEQVRKPKIVKTISDMPENQGASQSSDQFDKNFDQEFDDKNQNY